MSLIKNDFFSLSGVSEDALLRRLANSEEYTVNEIEMVKARSERLFPFDFELSEELTEDFRVLAKHTRVELTPRNLSSHRKYIGPVIVASKRILFKLLSAILKDTLGAQEIYNRHMLKVLAKRVQ
jgi:hypothetical protein